MLRNFEAKKITLIVLAALFCLICTSGGFADSAASVSDNEDSTVGFPISLHKKIRDRALTAAIAELDLDVQPKTLKRWRKQLKRSSLRQDIFRFFWSRYHFDNCTFMQGIEQIRKFQREIEADHEKLRISASRKQRDKYRGRMMFRIGRIVHALQDFYSHSNFVELNSAKYAEITDVPMVDIWNQRGQDELLGGIKGGLVSHYSLFSFPKKCSPKPTMSLAKDPGNSRAGSVRTNWRNSGRGDFYTAFEAAEMLSEAATKQVFLELFRKYPLFVSEADS